MSRIDDTFNVLKTKKRAAFISFIMAGDPDVEKSFEIMCGLPDAGVDIIELGMPFTDPMADGPAVQLAGQRALRAGHTMEKTLDMVTQFRETNTKTPIVLMGYYNPIYSMGVDNFIAKAVKAGVDGLIVVDLPPEEDTELCIPANAAGLNFIRLMTPTTDSKRLPKALENTSGFIYYVSINGITGTAEAQANSIGPEVERIKTTTDIPVCVGFGIRSAKTVRDIANISDGAVVGSAIIDLIKDNKSVPEILSFVKELTDGTRI